MWSLSVQCHAVGVGGLHAEVHAHQGQFFAPQNCLFVAKCLLKVYSLLQNKLLTCFLQDLSCCASSKITDNMKETSLCLLIRSTEHRLPVAVSVGGLRDVGGPGADLPSDLRGGQ